MIVHVFDNPFKMGYSYSKLIALSFGARIKFPNRSWTEIRRQVELSSIIGGLRYSNNNSYLISYNGAWNGSKLLHEVKSGH